MSENTVQADDHRRPRLGDLFVCFGFLLAVALFVLATSNAARNDDWFRTIHYGTTTIVFGVCAVLTVVRGAAIAKRPGWRPRALAAIGNFAIIPLAALPLTWEPDWLMTLATLGIVAAYLWMVWALITLRRGFSVFPEARLLVTDGPYAIVRHPIYAASVLIYLLVALPRVSMFALLIAGVGMAAELMRAKNEEQILAGAIPTYHDYADRVPEFFLTRRREISPELPTATLEHQDDSEVLAA